jgi:hypothetical protein
MSKVFYPQKGDGWNGVETETYKNRKEVEKVAGAVVKIVKVEGGWLAFEFWTDYDIWRQQK